MFILEHTGIILEKQKPILKMLINDFRRHKMQIINENGYKIKEYTIYKSFLLTVRLMESIFIFVMENGT